MFASEVANLVHKAVGAVVIPLPLAAISEEGSGSGEHMKNMRETL